MEPVDVWTEFVGDKLHVYARKKNPGSPELIAALPFDSAVNLYLNVKKQVEGQLFKTSEDAVILYSILIKENPELKERVDEYKKRLEKVPQSNSSP
jgi:hypothetical protein